MRDPHLRGTLDVTIPFSSGSQSVYHSSALGTDEAWHLGNALTGPAQIAHDLERCRRVQTGSRAWPSSKRGNVMADALADITSIQLRGFAYEAPYEVYPKILREDGLASP